MQNNLIATAFGVSEKAVSFVEQAHEELAPVFARLEKTEFLTQAKVLNALQEEGIGLRHFAPTTGYGYDDIGRDALDRVFARSLGCEDALVRPQIASGTHALYLGISGLLLPGDTLLCATGKPYDTLEEAIGISGDAFGSLKQFNIAYDQVDLTADGKIDLVKLEKALASAPKVVHFQRSRGYAWRDALLPEDMADAFALVKKLAPNAYITVDNCYGEFTAEQEPSAFGADVLIGSLIKNPGGGIAPTGGYIAGKHECIEMIANRMTAPGIGREVGSYAGSYAPFFQGLFLAPHVTCQSLKSAALFARVFEKAGMLTMPASDAVRSDIIQSVQFRTAESLIAFCQSIQKASPVDSYVTPMPWDMPGYAHQVIMAAGAFVQGSSIELSADAPIVEPYTAYIQGSLTYSHGKIGVMLALNALIKLGEVEI